MCMSTAFISQQDLFMDGESLAVPMIGQKCVSEFWAMQYTWMQIRVFGMFIPSSFALHHFPTIFKQKEYQKYWMNCVRKGGFNERKWTAIKLPRTCSTQFLSGELITRIVDLHCTRYASQFINKLEYHSITWSQLKRKTQKGQMRNESLIQALVWMTIPAHKHVIVPLLTAKAWHIVHIDLVQSLQQNWLFPSPNTCVAYANSNE